MDRKAAIKAKILNKEDAIPNGLHLLRKHN